MGRPPARFGCGGILGLSGYDTRIEMSREAVVPKCTPIAYL